ncbi:FxSxx-COOH system tetratricopeptide repeat protein [Streptomyces sp. CA-132043]|uniref:FxSxx-COOH system tetratricopeptide repeat protein n=1 Tax=Streptomyces sp. CA-132043 TaxID=3240048 RepID=UPI003D91D65E
MNRSPTARGARSVAAGRDIGQAITGDHAVGWQYQSGDGPVLPTEALLAPESVEGPGHLSNLPLRPGDLFVGREEELALLNRASANTTGQVAHVVHGLGGIGKTTLAAQWACSQDAECNLTWWITSDTSASIDAGLANLAIALQPTLSMVATQEALRAWALRWLASHEGWLLVLDDVVDPQDVRPLLCAAGNGRILLTSRRATGWNELATPLALNVLPATDSARLVTQALSQEGNVVDGAAELCAELGHLPLALKQAGAFCAETRTSPRYYLELLAQYPADMYATTAESLAERTIARVWHVTLDRLADDPLTHQILRVLAWYSADCIPRTLLQPLARPPALLNAVGRLAAHSMLTIHDETSSLQVHKLVQAVTRTPDQTDRHRQPKEIIEARITATELIQRVLPVAFDDPVTLPAWRSLLPHIAALADNRPPESDDARMISVLDHTGKHLLWRGTTGKAAAYFTRALAACAHHREADDPAPLTIQHNLACAHRDAGRLQEAIQLFEKSITEGTRALGKDHRSVLSTRDNLASAYLAAGRTAAAIRLFEQCLEDRYRVLGHEHIDTLRSLSNLASAYQQSGNISWALPMYQATLNAFTRLMGKEHSETFAAYNNLANAYVVAGEPSLAVPLLRKSLADQERLLGEDHLDTLRTAHNLSHALSEAGDFEEARSLGERNVPLMKRVLGSEHPLTLEAQNGIAVDCVIAGDVERAIGLLQENLACSIRIRGADHPTTLNTRSNLARAYEAHGDLRRAFMLNKQTLTDRIRVQGANHPDTLAAQSHLAITCISAGNFRRAISLLNDAVVGRTRILGNDHPDTLNSRNNLASAYRRAGDREKSSTLFESLLADCVRRLGKNHPYTLTVERNLAEARGAALPTHSVKNRSDFAG